MKKLSVGFIALFAFVLLLSACSGSGNDNSDAESGNATENTESNDDKEDNSDMQAEATLINDEGDNIGSAVLTETDEGVSIKYDIAHLPEGEHGFHIHESGACETPDFESADGHFNPNDDEHGFDNEEGPHAGDLPNLEVDEDGNANGEALAEMVTLEEGEDNSLLKEGGTSIVIHADPDDNQSQPAGDAGDRIACGVIEK